MIDEAIKYVVGRRKDGTTICKFMFDWEDDDGKKHVIETDDIDSAKNIIDLLSGEITLADLLP